MRKSILLTIGVFFFCITTPVHAFSLPDSGQVLFYDNAGNIIEEPMQGNGYYGQDASYLINPPVFTKLDSLGQALDSASSDWTSVLDNNTGLTWKTESVYQSVTTYSWTDANAHIDNLNNTNYGGRNDWRMPSIFELQTLVNYNEIVPEYGSNNSAVYKEYFPNLRGNFWSNNIYKYMEEMSGTEEAWVIGYNQGQVGPMDRATGVEQVIAVAGLIPVPEIRFVDNSDGTVTDKLTDLMWKQEPISYATWREALEFSEGLIFADYDDWRLPNINEARSIINYDLWGVALDPLLAYDYLGGGHPWFITSTTNADYNTRLNPNAWAVSYYHGQVDPNRSKTSPHYWFFTVRNADKNIVPEPATMLLFGIGLTGLALRRRLA